MSASPAADTRPKCHKPITQTFLLSMSIKLLGLIEHAADGNSHGLTGAVPGRPPHGADFGNIQGDLGLITQPAPLPPLDFDFAVLEFHFFYDHFSDIENQGFIRRADIKAIAKAFAFLNRGMLHHMQHTRDAFFGKEITLGLRSVTQNFKLFGVVFELVDKVKNHSMRDAGRNHVPKTENPGMEPEKMGIRADQSFTAKLGSSVK